MIHLLYGERWENRKWKILKSLVANLNSWQSLPFLVVVPGKLDQETGMLWLVLVSYEPNSWQGASWLWIRVISTVQIFINHTLSDCLPLFQLAPKELCVNHHGRGLWFWASQRVTETEARRNAAGGREVSYTGWFTLSLAHFFKHWICCQSISLSIIIFKWFNKIQITVIPMMNWILF